MIQSAPLRRPVVYEARRARLDMSLPEVLLWQRLKGSPQGVAFRKQHPVAGYRADFYCAAAKLIIEVDGASHDMGDRPQRDEKRTQKLEGRGYRIIRIPAADVLRNADSVAEAVIALAKSSPLTGRGTGEAGGGGHPPAPSPSETPLHPSAAPSGPPPRTRGGA
jgi:very-short-patch-repair endonuclease